MADAMNAEISLGTVATVRDAIRWLGYTYLFVRMQKTPLTYGELSFCERNHVSYSSMEDCLMMTCEMIRR
jgi:replicative superfamily II helicase